MRWWVPSVLSDCNENQKMFSILQERARSSKKIHWFFLSTSSLFCPTTMCNVQGSDNMRHNMTPGQLATFLCISTAGAILILWWKPRGHLSLQPMNQDWEVKYNLKFMGHKPLHLALTGTRSWCIPWWCGLAPAGSSAPCSPSLTPPVGWGTESEGWKWGSSCVEIKTV